MKLFKGVLVSVAVVLVISPLAHAEQSDKGAHAHHMGHSMPGMRMDMLSMVMHENKNTLPQDCQEISREVSITVKAGRKYAQNFNGTTFGFDAHSWQVPPCSRITVTFINEDNIRHQWMVHGLPKYLYPQGMFHMELNRKGQTTGTFIVPGDDKTYLVHCDMAQHMERGMKAQLLVGKGNGNLPSIPGISGAYIQPKL